MLTYISKEEEEEAVVVSEKEEEEEEEDGGWSDSNPAGWRSFEGRLTV